MTAPARREKPQKIADELRVEIIDGQLADGTRLGNEADLIDRFGVSRPSLREGLRILEAEGLISVIRGVNGGVVARQPDHRQAARTAAIVLQARNVPLADVSAARTIIEPAAVRLVAASKNRGRRLQRLRDLVDDQEAAIEDPESFGIANARFHEELVAMAGNETLTILTEMLHEIVAHAVTAVSQSDGNGSVDTRRRGVRSQRRLLEMLDAGDAEGAEAHWRTHMDVVGRVMMGQQAKTVIDLMNHN